MNITIDQATIKDAIVIRGLLTSLFLELGEESSSIMFLSDEAIQSIMRSGRTTIFLARTNNDIAGIMTITESQAIYAGGSYGIIDEMFVLPEYRCREIGKQLIGSARQLAQRKGWSRIDVTTPTEARWIRTNEFYKKAGFLFTGSKLKLQC